MTAEEGDQPGLLVGVVGVVGDRDPEPRHLPLNPAQPRLGSSWCSTTTS